MWYNRNRNVSVVSNANFILFDDNYYCATQPNQLPQEMFRQIRHNAKYTEGRSGPDMSGGTGDESVKSILDLLNLIPRGTSSDNNR